MTETGLGTSQFPYNNWSSQNTGLLLRRQLLVLPNTVVTKKSYIITRQRPFLIIRLLLSSEDSTTRNRMWKVPWWRIAKSIPQKFQLGDEVFELFYSLLLLTTIRYTNNNWRQYVNLLLLLLAKWRYILSPLQICVQEFFHFTLWYAWVRSEGKLRSSKILY